MEAWASSLAAGVSDDVFWDGTPKEVTMLVQAIGKRERAHQRAANLRAALVASAVYNVHRKKGQKVIAPEDLLVDESKPTLLPPDQFLGMMREWAGRTNRKFKGKRANKRKQVIA